MEPEKTERKKRKVSAGYIIVFTVLMLLCIALCVFMTVAVYMRGGSGCVFSLPQEKAETVTQYVLYIGTNDKDTYRQEISTDDAIDIVDGICLSHLDGYTLTRAEGRWLDETHTVTVEDTIVCYIDGADRDTVYAICDEVIAALNQSTVLVETNEVTMDYYGGK